MTPLLFFYKKMKNQYDKIAQKYHLETERDLYNNDKWKLKFDMIEQPKITKTKNWNILDLGCGSGIHVKYFTEQHPELNCIIGIDTSKELIKIARKQNTSNKIQYFVGNYNKLPFKNNYFDYIFSRYGIHYSSDLNITFAEIARVVKNKGKVYFLDSHPLYNLFLKKNKDYMTKENTKFNIQGGTETVIHPTFTFSEYINAIAINKFKIIKMNEFCGRTSRRGKFFVPVSFSLLLKK
jgi:ubiquinone/menaquinone biosynthesis C-methylase UbiE